MTTQALEKKLRPYMEPVQGDFLRWLYLHLPPRPITRRKSHAAYTQAVSLLLHELEMGRVSPGDRRSIEGYLNAIVPFVEEYEKRRFRLKRITPEDMLRFLMEQNHLSQYDLAGELGGQPVVSHILRGERKLTREHIERLSRRFGLSPAAFYSAA